MSIVLRNLKGSALTYTEMDRNQAQFFYSASVAASTLQLHYTGSSVLNSDGQSDYEPRFVEVPLASGSSNLILQPGNGISIGTEDGITTITNIGTAAPGDPNAYIQFNKGGSFAGDNIFLYNSDKKRVGLGLASTLSIARRLHIVGAASQGAIIRLQSFFDINSNNIGNADETAFLEICSGGERTSRDNQDNIFGKFGKVDQGEDPQLHINRYFEYGKTHFSFGQDHKISHTVLPNAIAINATDTKRNLAVVGEHGIGIGQNQDTQENRIRPLPNGVWSTSFIQLGVQGTPQLNVTRKGLAIHSPMNQDDGGNILIGISDNAEGHISSNGRDPNRLLINGFIGGDNMSLESNPRSYIASFLSNGTVGVGTPNPDTDIRLDINGNYRGATDDTYVNWSGDIPLNFTDYSFTEATASDNVRFVEGSSGIPLKGTKGVILIKNNANKPITVTTENVYSPNGDNIEIAASSNATFSFISDGAKLYMTGFLTNLEL